MLFSGCFVNGALVGTQRPLNDLGTCRARLGSGVSVWGADLGQARWGEGANMLLPVRKELIFHRDASVHFLVERRERRGGVDS